MAQVSFVQIAIPTVARELLYTAFLNFFWIAIWTKETLPPDLPRLEIVPTSSDLGVWLSPLKTLESLCPIFVWLTDALVALTMRHQQIWSFPIIVTVSMRMDCWKANLSVGLKFLLLFQRLKNTRVVTVHYSRQFTLQETVHELRIWLLTDSISVWSFVCRD
jgi:hypothetical protein